MKTEVQWLVAVQNPVTGEWLRFLGQGKTVAEAVADGVKNLQAPYRPSSDGRVMPGVGLGVPPRTAVRLTDGSTVLRKLDDFESERPYDAAKEAKTLPECEPADYLNKARPFSQMFLSDAEAEKIAKAKKEDCATLALGL